MKGEHFSCRPYRLAHSHHTAELKAPLLTRFTTKNTEELSAMSQHAFNSLSAFSIASFEMDAISGGTYRFAEAIEGVEDQISFSPQAMGMLGVSTSGGWATEEDGSLVG